MNKNKLAVQIGSLSLLAAVTFGAQAAALNSGDLLTITAGVPTYDSYGYLANVSGSWFGSDMWGAYFTTLPDVKTPINPGADGGIVIGSIQAATSLYPSAGRIDQWFLNGGNGQHYTASAIFGDTTTGLDLSGWRLHWGQTDATARFVNYGTGAWQPLNCVDLGCAGYTFTDGVARFQWDGIYGHAYTLDYTAMVPLDDFGGGTPYYLHLEGTVQAVPVPAAFWLLGSGVLGLGVVARRKRRRS